MEQNPDTNAVVEWPTDEGIWMANFPDGIGWLPMETLALRDDLPSKEQRRLEYEHEAPPRKILAIVARLPLRDGSWPYVFKGTHPAKEWRRPTADEMKRARVFLGLEPA